MKKLILLLGLLSLPFAINADINNVQQLISDKNFKQALKSVDSLLNKQPNDHQALFLRAISLQRLGRVDDAISAYKKLTVEAPSLPEPYNNLAVLYAKQGNENAARDALIKAIKTNHSYATAYENLSSIYAGMAVNAYNKALEINKKKRPIKTTLNTIDKLDVKPITPVAIQIAKIPLVKKLPVIKNKPPIVLKDESALIIDTIYGWSNAWSAQNADAYLSYYATAFKPPSGLSRSKWEKQRRIRLKKPSFIKISVKQPIVKMLSEKSALLSFNQNYSSNSFHDAVQKTLLLEKVDGSWQILKEFTSS